MQLKPEPGAGDFLVAPAPALTGSNWIKNWLLWLRLCNSVQKPIFIVAELFGILLSDIISKFFKVDRPSGSVLDLPFLNTRDVYI